MSPGGAKWSEMGYTPATGARVFRGINTVTLDAKGRVAIPARYRDRLNEAAAGQVVATVDRERCLLLYPLPEWEVIERKLTRLPSLNPQVRKLLGLLLGHATELELDGHGRILLPQMLRDFARLERRAVLVGQGNKFELWDEQRWIDRRESWLEEDSDAVALPAELESLSL